MLDVSRELVCHLAGLLATERRNPRNPDEHQTTTSVRGKTIDAWYAGKHRDFGANVQAVACPDGLPIWTSPASPGPRPALPAPQHQDTLGPLYWAAAQLPLPTLADSGIRRRRSRHQDSRQAARRRQSPRRRQPGL